MPIRKLLKILSWSFSRFSDYEKCPALAKYKHVERRKEPPNKAMERGSLAHAAAEQAVTGKRAGNFTDFSPESRAVLDLQLKSKELPEILSRFPEEFAMLKAKKAEAETSWTFTKDWESCNWDDWNIAWLRIKVDNHYLETTGPKRKQVLTVNVVDHKTGKIDCNPKYKFGGKEDPGKHDLQAELYALGALLKYPDAANVVVKYYYLDEGQEGELHYKASDLEKLKSKWVQRSKQMLTDTRFAPNPGPHCKWCFFRKDNGGPCEY